MARSARIEIVGGWYYVTNQGAEDQVIFGRPEYYRRFIELLSELPERFGVRIAGYVLLPGQYHLQLETPQKNLSRAIQWLNVSYGVWFNRKKKRVGPVFRGRFKAILHEPRQFAVAINQSLHLIPANPAAIANPKAKPEAKKGLRNSGTNSKHSRRDIQNAISYPWSSIRTYLGGEPSPKWLTAEAIWAHYGTKSGKARFQAYQKQLEELLGTEEMGSGWKKEIKFSVLLGGKGFRDRMRMKLRNDENNERERRGAGRNLLRWERIQAAIVKVMGGSWEKLVQLHGDPGRDVAMYIARRYGGMSLREIGEHCEGMRYSAVSTAVRRFQDRLGEDRKAAQLLAKVKQALHI